MLCADGRLYMDGVLTLTAAAFDDPHRVFRDLARMRAQIDLVHQARI